MEDAKGTVDKQLEKFRKDILAEIKTQTLAANDTDSTCLDVIAKHAKKIASLDPFLSSNSYRGTIAEIMKLKDIKEYSIPNTKTMEYLNRLLVIISGISRLLGYLDID